MKSAIRLCDHVPVLIRGFLDGGVEMASAIR